MSSPLGTAAMSQAIPGWQVMPGSQVMPCWQRVPGAAVALEHPRAKREAARAEGTVSLQLPERTPLLAVLGLWVQLCVMLCAKQQLFSECLFYGSSPPGTQHVGSLSQFRTNSRLPAVQRCCQLEPAGQNLGVGSAGTGGSRGSASVGSCCQPS